MSAPPPSGVVTLLSDFGGEDWFVAAMKGVIASLAPRTRTIDITHQVPPGDIRRGALALYCAYRSFPPGTVHLAVVDPGVGSDRAALAARAGSHFFVAPDNGLLSWVLREEDDQAVFRAERGDLFLPEISATFHGRDVFAPLAARLAAGFPIEEVGETHPHPLLLPLPLLRNAGKNRWEVEIIGRDRFGNCLTSLARQSAGYTGGEGETTVRIRPVRGPAIFLPLLDCYRAAGTSAPLAIWGSCGFLELAVNGGSAARELGLEIGDRIGLEFTAGEVSEKAVAPSRRREKWRL